ncbi:FxSxx-COOH system tetratricopeptide repeat protein [Saccharothrix xinjiangensis]|uniref:FxSxx-COOH system tetratricopeptide repeat protein n=1 Tax=Saccharothrix xinjiangensis TaxID=204798 RepID=A0ABV9Y050_9PSEU
MAVGERGGGHQVGAASGSAVLFQAGRDVTVIGGDLVTGGRGGPDRVVWPVRVGVPPQPAEPHQPRDAQSVFEDGSGAGGVTLLGLGGVGKSQVAARHAWSVWPDASVGLAVWASALTRDGVLTAYAEAARKVLCEDDPRISSRTPEQAARSLRSWLATTGRRWLVVLDDVQDPDDLRDLWPPRHPLGRTVVTTRRRDVLFARGRGVVELGVYTEREATRYLARALPGEVVAEAGEEQVRALGADLGFLPLALAQAAAFISDRPLLTVRGYRRRLADRRRTLAEVMPTAEELPDEHQATVAATWSLSIERADRLPPAGLARPLLELVSLLDPHGTPRALFTSPPVLSHLAATTGREVDGGTVEDALGCLHRLHLIDLDRTRPSRTVTAHALVQRAVRDTLAPDHLHRLAHTAADALLSTWPDIDTTTPGTAQALRSAAEVLHARTTPALWHGQAHELLLLAGRSLGESGQVAAVIAYFRDLHRQALAHLGPDHPDTLVVRHNLASWRGQAGDVAGAFDDYRALLTDCLRVLGDDHPDTLVTRNNLAHWRGMAGDARSAVPELEALLADHLRVLGDDHPDTFGTRNNLADLRGQAGDVAGAVTGFEVLLVDRLRVLGPDHPHTLVTRNNLAHWRGEAGDTAGAVAELEALLADQRRVMGPDHPETLVTRGNLARRRGEAGDAAGAVRSYRELVSDFVRVVGPDHPDTFIARGNLAHWLGRTGDVGGAVAELEALLADHLRVLGPEHPNTSVTRANLAHWRGAGDLRP